jgi:predicted ATPase
MYLTRVRLREPLPGGWPFTLPPVRALTGDGLAFDRAVTFLVGENGSGKSTLVEALADLVKISNNGGKAGTRYAPPSNGPTTLGAALEADYTVEGLRVLRGPQRSRTAFFFRAETLFDLGQNVSGLPGFWPSSLDTQSHGEGFLHVMAHQLSKPGLYLLDEPEAALSFTSCLGLVAQLDELVRAGGQVICATHSPVLTALPGARILELTDQGIQPVEWKDLQLVDHLRRYLADPNSYLRRLLP